ncbi:hypothetical protein KP509_17G011200 [Ceratopteris richardii]|uniref:Uncharacterized protein n=1 Tax=Ceratopteris richardii TaxID=49495 RepID=A0A8T2SWV0_CERRI|nr:hypothetical protein KP509_17G011200 [Ceratopteris richardii]
MPLWYGQSGKLMVDALLVNMSVTSLTIFALSRLSEGEFPRTLSQEDGDSWGRLLSHHRSLRSIEICQYEVPASSLYNILASLQKSFSLHSLTVASESVGKGYSKAQVLDLLRQSRTFYNLRLNIGALVCEANGLVPFSTSPFG